MTQTTVTIHFTVDECKAVRAFVDRLPIKLAAELARNSDLRWALERLCRAANLPGLYPDLRAHTPKHHRSAGDVIETGKNSDGRARMIEYDTSGNVDDELCGHCSRTRTWHREKRPRHRFVSFTVPRYEVRS